MSDFFFSQNSLQISEYKYRVKTTNMENQTEIVNDWNNLAITILDEDQVIAAIRMRKQDIDFMLENNNASSRAEILDLLLKTLETTKNPEEEKES
jgi:hypothetical protein